MALSLCLSGVPVMPAAIGDTDETSVAESTETADPDTGEDPVVDPSETSEDPVEEETSQDESTSVEESTETPSEENSEFTEEEKSEEEKAAEKKKIEKKIAAVEKKLDEAASKASGLSKLQAKLANKQDEFDDRSEGAATAAAKLKKLKKSIENTKTLIDRAQTVVRAVEEELAAAEDPDLWTMLNGEVSLYDAESRDYLLQTISTDRRIAIVKLQQKLESQIYRKGKLEKKIVKASNKLVNATDKVTEAAFAIEAQCSEMRDAYQEAQELAKELGKTDEEVETKEAVEAAAKRYATLREGALVSVSSWYADLEDLGGLDDALTFGTGIEFTLTKKQFVKKWGKAIDAFFENYGNSPLYGYGKTMAKMAWKYKIDPRLCAAVSIIESGGGQVCIKSCNAWGWGAADSDPSGLALSWDTWESAIEAWHDGVANNDAGMFESETIEELGAIYCSSGDWASNVSAQMLAISELAK